jgi:hypothetical protein
VVWDPLHGRRRVPVFGRGKKYVITSGFRLGYGPTFPSQPYSVVSRVASDDELGAAVIDAVEGHTVLNEDPSDVDVDAAAAELRAVVGVKDRRTFERGASLVYVDEHRRRWTVEPWGRRRGYWAPLGEETFLKLSAPSASEIGAAVRSAFVGLRGRP